jgi:hypothetical protein
VATIVAALGWLVVDLGWLVVAVLWRDAALWAPTAPLDSLVAGDVARGRRAPVALRRCGGAGRHVGMAGRHGARAGSILTPSSGAPCPRVRREGAPAPHTATPGGRFGVPHDRDLVDVEVVPTKP